MTKLNNKKDDFKKVRTFIKGLTAAEYRYMELTMQMVNTFHSIINKYKLTKERFCELFKINPKVYDNYVNGNFNYTVNDMAMIDAVYHILEIERVEKEELIKISSQAEEHE